MGSEGASPADLVDGLKRPIPPLDVAFVARTSGSDEVERPRSDRLALAMVPIVGMVLCIVATRNGVIIGQDSAAYLGAASNLLHGRGLTTPFNLSESTLTPSQVFAFKNAIPLVHFPPLYPVVVAIVASTGLSVIESARWLNILLLGGNLLMFELLVRRFTRSRWILPAAGAGLLLLAPALYHATFLSFHASALSEPALLFLLFVCLLHVVKYIDQPSSSSLAMICLCAATAPLVRYAGAAIVPAAAVALFAWAPMGWLRRAKLSGVVLVAGVVPSAGWQWWASHVEHGGSARSLLWHPEHSILHFTLNVLSGWILPGSMSPDARDAILLLFGVALTYLLIRQWRGSSEGKRRAIPVLVLGLFVLAYLAVVFVTRDALDAILSMSPRILLPLLPMLYLAALTIVTKAVHSYRWGERAVALGCGAVALAFLGTTGAVVASPPNPDRGVQSWPIMRAVAALPPHTVVASSVPDLIYTATGRPSLGLPSLKEPLNDRYNLRFFTELQQMATILIQHHGVLVVAPEGLGDATVDSAWPANFKPYAHVYVAHRYADGGVIWRFLPLTRSA